MATTTQGWVNKLLQNPQLKPLTGTPSQVAWATRIRAEKLEEIRVRLEQAMQQGAKSGTSVQGEYKTLFAGLIRSLKEESRAMTWIGLKDKTWTEVLYSKSRRGN